MRIPGLKRARMAGRWLRSRSGARSLVLGYHLVTDDPFDPYHISVAREAFAAQLEAIRKVAEPMSLSALVDGVLTGSLRHGAVAVTFDDAYAEVVTDALPLLQRFEIPATVFVITGMLGTELWWDKLARAIPRNDNHASTVTESYHRLVEMSPTQRSASLKELEAEFVDASAEATGRRTMTLAELQQLGRSDLIEIGSHSVSHIPAKRLPAADLEREYADSKSYLETVLARDIKWLSYPNGSWTEEAKSIARHVGYQAAFSSVNDAVATTSDRMCLPRFWPRNVDAATFEHWLRRWL